MRVGPNGGLVYDTELERVQAQREANLREAEAVQVVAMRQSLAALAVKVREAYNQAEIEKKKVAALKYEAQRLRPQWPATFDPVEQTATKPPPPPPPDPKAVAALAERMKQDADRAKDPLALGSPPATRPATPLAPKTLTPPPPAAPSSPTTAPAAQPPNVPFGPREIDKQRGR